MSALIALHAVFGQDEANHGTRRYRVDSDGLVHVPAEVAFFLVSNGGFAVAKTTVVLVPGCSPPVPPPEACSADTDPNPMVRLHHDAGHGCTHGGYEHQSDDSGEVLVPADAVVDLTSGWSRADDSGSAPDEIRTGTESD